VCVFLMSPFNHFLQSRLDGRREKKLYRQRSILESPQSVHLQVNGKKCISFCSNDYLGLANHPKVIESFQSAAKRWGVGSGASHLVSGHSSEHHALEEELAAFTGRESTILFSTGYMANLGCITALMQEGDAVFEDKLNHASLLDAGLASGAKFQRFLHGDMDNLQLRLKKSDAEKKLIVVDGVFSMDGDFAPLDQLSVLAAQHNAWLMVDDAHGLGCLGKNGGGTAELFSLTQNKLPILMGTLGKSFGTFGAFIAGSRLLTENLIQFARSYIYTTALPPAVAAASRTSLRLIQEESWRREHLQTLIHAFRKGAEDSGLQLMPSASPIQPIMIGDEEKALRISKKLFERGFWVVAIRPPTVPAGTSRLRITLSAEHSLQQVENLLSALRQAIADY
jgi:8-amino-7-oxononanoate synthase